MLEWDDVRYFLAVHRARSLSAAARTLSVNQSTVGRRIAALEASLDARLFFQTPDGYLLAPAGERMLPRVERMEDEALAIARELSGEDCALTGALRLTAPDAFGARVVTPLLARFHAKYPDIELELVADNRALSLSKREADLALRVGRPKETSLVVRRVADFGCGLYASTAYLEARGRPRGLDFSGHDFIGVDQGAGPERDWLLQHSRRGRIVFTCNATLAQVEATREGMGLSVLPCYVGDPEPELVRLLPPSEVVMRAVWLVLHRDLQHAARVRACADFLVEALVARGSDLRGEKRPRKAAR